LDAVTEVHYVLFDVMSNLIGSGYFINFTILLLLFQLAWDFVTRLLGPVSVS